jgi:hypothetical protein
VRAETHTELYRRFRGELQPRALRFWPLLAAGVRTGTKKKLPLLLLFIPVAITTIVYSFIVYGKYAAEDVTQEMGGFRGMAALFAQRAMVNIRVADQIADANQTMQLFALLAIAWYGAGVLAEDRRLGAHLLYFARPLTRLDYFLGKFLTVACFGALASLLPGLFICLVAAWSSPEWSFLREEGEVLWQTCAYASIWIVLTSSLVLCASSLVRRKTLALAGVFGFFMLDHALGGVLGEVDGRYQAISLLFDVRKLRAWIFGLDDWRAMEFGVDTAGLIVCGVVAVSLAVVGWRISKLEVVG